MHCPPIKTPFIGGLILAEIQLPHGQGAVDQLIGELDLESRFDLMQGTDFSTVGR